MEQDAASTLRKERLVSVLLFLAGLTALLAAFHEKPWGYNRVDQILAALLFTGVVVFVDQFPIHLARGMKASLTNVPIYLGAVLLAPPLAVLVAGSGMLIAETRARKARSLYVRDIVATTGQWMVITYVSSLSFSIQLTGVPGGIDKIASLVIGASAFLILDIFFFALSTTFILQQPFLYTFRSAFQESLIVEGAQYILAILSALAVLENPWFLLFLIFPGVSLYVLFKNTREVKEDTLHLLEDMADIVDLRDVYTGGHSKRVAQLVEETLDHMNILGQEAEIIATAARLHDIGKIGIPDDILKKPGKLSLEEMNIMQTHPDLGADLISKYKTFSRGVAMIRHHHERWDGRGYPARLRGHEIPFGARVIAVADSFDAMTSDRTYRRALSEKQALQILRDGRDKQWDGMIVNAFVEFMSNRISEDRYMPAKVIETQVPHILPQKTLLP